MVQPKEAPQEDVLTGIFAARKVVLAAIKYNALNIMITNHDGILELVKFAR